jgi:hypothetical protein
MKSVIQAFSSNLKFGRETIYFINENNLEKEQSLPPKKCPFQLGEMTSLSNLVCNFEKDYIIKIKVVKPKIKALQNPNH